MTVVTVALPAVPSLEGTAAGRCAVAMLTGLAAHGVTPHAVAARRPGSQAGVAPPDVEVVDVPEDRSRWHIHSRRVLRPRGELARGAFRAAVEASSARSDLLHLEEVDTSWLGERVTCPVVVHLHHLVRLDRDPGRPWTRAFREVLEFAAAERSAARRHACFVASSPVVRDFLHRQAPGARIVDAPLSLVPSHYPQAELGVLPVAGLIGTATWSPTARAVERLLLRVWPRVVAELPTARLRLAGRGMASLVARIPHDASTVEVVGEVPDASVFLSSLELLLYPLERGSGMKVKVLESLACGLPVVTTRLGAEGLSDDDGIVRRESDVDLADAAVELLRDPLARRQRGQAARALFTQKYSPEPATAPLVDLYQELATRTAS